jgi:hypothetical protein
METAVLWARISEELTGSIVRVDESTNSVRFLSAPTRNSIIDLKTEVDIFIFCDCTFYSWDQSDLRHGAKRLAAGKAR